MSPEREIHSDLLRWAQAHYSEEASIERLERMPGHSGITYGFDLVDPSRERVGVVMRVPPVGVRHDHNLDVVRLEPVLKMVAAAGICVPTVLASGTDESWFGTPYLMVSRVEGEPLPDVFDASNSPGGYPDRVRVDSIFRQAVASLAQVHSIDPQPLMKSGWASPVSVADDLEQWTRLLLKSDVEQEIAATHELRRRLMATAPRSTRTTIVHGDFYSNNWLVNEGRVTSLLDWENATVNRPMWDLGWIATIFDPQCWGPSRSTGMTWHPLPEDIYGWYEDSSPGGIEHPEWYQALMCYRLASITPSKVRLHRTGRRVDPIWEVFAEAVPYQLDRAFSLLQEDT